MKSLIFLLSFFPHVLLSAQITHTEVRTNFPKAVKEEKYCVELLEKLADLAPNDYILIAYRGAANIVMAKYVSSPAKRLGYYMDGKKELEHSLEKMPLNVELHFLRFTIQQNTPPALFYDDREEDVAFIIKHLGDVKDDHYRDRIKNFLKESGQCSEEQLQALNR